MKVKILLNVLDSMRHLIEKIGQLGKNPGWQRYRQKQERKRGRMRSIWPKLMQPKTRPRFRLKKLSLKELELKSQDQAHTSATADPPPCNKGAKFLKLPAFLQIGWSSYVIKLKMM